jgi:3-deoxy-D-manno-octulosonic-acid transferase
VGEVGVAATVMASLPPDLPLLVTTVTPTGQERARALFRDRAMVAYLPFDLGFPLNRFLRRFEPRALILVEGDYWPLLLHKLERRQVPVAVVNGRVSARSHGRMSRVPSLASRLLGSVSRFGVQSREDLQRLQSLGVPEERIEVTGNLKFESPEPPSLPELELALQALARDRSILVAGSTMPGEDEQVLAALRQSGDGAMLILAPRHPERWNDVENLARQQGLEVVRRSRLPTAGAPRVILLDSLGELAALYRIAHSAFIGGTLVPTGGHNPLEAARFGVAVVVGPSMENFQQMADIFDQEEAWYRVASAGELAALWHRWQPENQDGNRERQQIGSKARALVESNRGALDRTRSLIEPLLIRVAGELVRDRP